MSRKRSAAPKLLLPRAVRGADSVAREAFNDLVTIAREIDELEMDLVLLVVAARQKGLSWDSIGSAIGTSGTAARKRFMEAADEAVDQAAQ